METIDSLNFQENTSAQELAVNSAIKDYLLQTAKWGKFLAIVGFVFVGLIAVAALFIGTIFSYMSSMSGSGGMGAIPGAMSAVFTVIYLGLAVLFFFPTLYLFQFSSKTQKALKNNAQIDLTEAFSKLKSLFKFWGIYTVVFLSIYGVFFFFAILIALIK